MPVDARPQTNTAAPEGTAVKRRTGVLLFGPKPDAYWSQPVIISSVIWAG